MKVKLSTTIFLLLAVFFVILLLGGPILVSAQGVAPFIEIENPLKFNEVGEIISAITGLLKTIGLGIAFLMLIWGGIQIMTAAGSEEKVKQGKKTITYTLIGYAIILGVDFMVDFVKEILKVK